jgi:hypothetical protein
VSNAPHIPKLTPGASIEITRVVMFTVNCPKCHEALDVTNLKFGTSMECPHCANVTWCPEFRPRWWFQFRNYLAALLLSFLIGALSSLFATWIWQKYSEAGSVGKGDTHVTEDKRH